MTRPQDAQRRVAIVSTNILMALLLVYSTFGITFWVFLANDQLTFICLQLFSWGYNNHVQVLGYSTDSHVNPTPKRISLGQGAIRFRASTTIFTRLTYMFFIHFCFANPHFGTWTYSVCPSDDGMIDNSVSIKLNYAIKVAFTLRPWFHF